MREFINQSTPLSNATQRSHATHDRIIACYDHGYD